MNLILCLDINARRDRILLINTSIGGIMSDTLKEVKEVIVDVLKVDDDNITPETRFIEDLKADSMDQFFLIDGFCEKFDITISDEDAREIQTVKDAVEYIDSKK
jgi:acyl carrier protein